MCVQASETYMRTCACNHARTNNNSNKNHSEGVSDPPSLGQQGAPDIPPFPCPAHMLEILAMQLYVIH